MAWDGETHRHSAWLIAAALNIVATRYLVFAKHVPHIMIILTVHITVALLFRVVEAYLWPTMCTATTWSKSFNHLSRLAIHIAAETTAIVCTYAALRAVPTLSTCLIMLSLDWPCETTYPLSRVSTISRRHSLLATILRVTVFFACLATILLLDYRLYAESILFLTLAAAASSLASIMTPPAGQNNLSVQEAADADISFLTHNVALISALAVAFLGFVILELPSVMQYMPPVPLWVALLSIVSGATALHLGGHPFRYTSRFGGVVDRCDASTSPRSRNYARLMIAGIITGLWAAAESKASLVMVQLCPWLLAVYITVGCNNGHKPKALETVTRTRDGGSTLNKTASMFLLLTSARAHDQSLEPQRQQRTWTHLIFTIASVAAIVNLVIAYPPFFLDARTSTVSALLSGNRGQSLDVVIVRYKEPAHGISTFLQTFSQLPRVRLRDLRVIIYDKGSGDGVTAAHNESQADQDDFTSILDLVTHLEVIHLPNTGREAATYLYHITNRWNDLADHTIFLQAQPHDVRALHRRVEDYLTSSTGFLPLSYPENTCKSCTNCHDLSGWHEDAEVLERLINAANGPVGRACGDLVLTYRGQFVVSAQRIRRNERDMYDQLRNWLVASQELTTVDEAPNLGQFQGAKSADNAGYTMERMWGSLFHCFNQDIPAKCPSFLSGMLRRPEDVGWCQCLDTA